LTDQSPAVNSSSSYLWGNVRATFSHTVYSTFLTSESSKKAPTNQTKLHS